MTYHSFNCFSDCLGPGLGTIGDFSSEQLLLDVADNVVPRTFPKRRRRPVN